MRRIQSALLFLFFAVIITERGSAQSQYPTGRQLPSADLERKIELAVKEYKGGNKEAFSKVDLKQPEAVQYLRKYVNDPDPDVRWYVAVSVRVHHTPEAMQILADLVRNSSGQSLHEALYSLEDHYSCKELVDSRLKNLVPNLIASANDYDKSGLPAEIRLLGCLAGQDSQAKKFLDESLNECESGKVAFPRYRNSQCGLLKLALARSGSAEAVASLLRGLKASMERGDPDELEGWLSDVQYIDDKELLSNLAELIKDKRGEFRPIPHSSEHRLRICDVAVSWFTRKLGGAVTGAETTVWRRHTDEELEQIYRRVKLYLESHGKSHTPDDA